MSLGERKRVYTGRHVRVDFQMNPEEIARCAVGPDLRDACHDVVVNRALPYAMSISPVSLRFDLDHVHYIDSFQVEDVLTGVAPESIGNPPMLRVGTRLLNVARHAAVVEFGRAGSRGHRVLGRTLDHLNTLRRPT